MRFPPIALFASTLLFTTMVAGDLPKTSGSPGIISHIKRVPVRSTAIAAIGYSKRLHALEIEFRNGAIYRYLGVTSKTHRELMVATSKARFYDKNIRGKYRSLHVRRQSR